MALGAPQAIEKRPMHKLSLELVEHACSLYSKEGANRACSYLRERERDPAPAVGRRHTQFEQAVHLPKRATTAEACASSQQLTASVPGWQVTIC